MHKPVKYFEKAVAVGANGVWQVFDRLNQIKQSPSFTPKWSDKPLLKSYQKAKPPLGWPRETDSLCPRCIPEIRQQIVDGKVDYKILLNEQVGEIKAKIIERDGKILMVKECAKHGALRRPDVDRSGVLRSTWKTFSRAATFAPTTTRSCTTTAPAPSRTAAARC